MAATAVSVKLTDDEKARLAKLAKATKRSAHFHMREAVQTYLDEAEWRLDFLREAEEAWEDYKRTGVGYSLEEVESWFKSDRSKAAPWQK